MLIDVTKYGVVPSPNAIGVDCLPALKTLLTTLQSSQQAILYFPAGAYRLSDTLDLSEFPYVRLTGDGFCGWSGDNPPIARGTILFGSVQGDLVRHVGAGISLHTRVADMTIFNPAGTALHIEGSFPSVERVRFFAGTIGLNMPANCFDPVITGCQFTGPGAWRPGNIGLQIHLLTNASVEHNYFAGWTEGGRFAGSGLTMVRNRLEENLYGLRLGMDPTGGKYLLTGSEFHGLDFEACGTAIDIWNIDSCTFETIGIQGHIASPPTPTSQSQYGINDHGSNNSDWRVIRVGGAYSSCGINVDQQGGGATPQTASWYRALAANSLGPAWTIADNAKPNTKFVDCNQP